MTVSHREQAKAADRNDKGRARKAAGTVQTRRIRAAAYPHESKTGENKRSGQTWQQSLSATVTAVVGETLYKQQRATCESPIQKQARSKTAYRSHPTDKSCCQENGTSSQQKVRTPEHKPGSRLPVPTDRAGASESVQRITASATVQTRLTGTFCTVASRYRASMSDTSTNSERKRREYHRYQSGTKPRCNLHKTEPQCQSHKVPAVPALLHTRDAQAPERVDAWHDTGQTKNKRGGRGVLAQRRKSKYHPHKWPHSSKDESLKIDNHYRSDSTNEEKY